jgi:hypothetical protein
MSLHGDSDREELHQKTLGDGVCSRQRVDHEFAKHEYLVAQPMTRWFNRPIVMCIQLSLEKYCAKVTPYLHH